MWKVAFRCRDHKDANWRQWTIWNQIGSFDSTREALVLICKAYYRPPEHIEQISPGIYKIAEEPDVEFRVFPAGIDPNGIDWRVDALASRISTMFRKVSSLDRMERHWNF
jgi:hypothetical protein